LTLKTSHVSGQTCRGLAYHAGSWRQSSNTICNMGDGHVVCQRRWPQTL